jgi:hypothetical protein
VVGVCSALDLEPQGGTQINLRPDPSPRGATGSYDGAAREGARVPGNHDS